MGIENYLLTSSVVAVLAQRLVRVLCSACKRPERATSSWLRSVGFEAAADGIEICRPGGCEQCAQTGYRGRVGIFELMDLNEEIRRKILANADASALAESARAQGMRTLAEDRLGESSDGRDEP